MKIAVWDTYVTKKDGTIMHFDIIAPDTIKNEQIIYTFGKEFLKSKNQENQALTSNECQFCHIEVASEKLTNEIIKNGYFIIEMENCS